MAVLKNRAKMSTSTTGTGTITLGSAEDGYQSFADAGVANADVVRYVIEDGNNFEIGTGTYTSSGTTLTRTVSESSNSDAAINLSGSATVFIGATAEDIPALYADNPSSATTPTASGDNAVAIGSQADVASGATGGFAAGFQADVNNQYAIAGPKARGWGNYGVAFGFEAQSQANHAVSIGSSSGANGARNTGAGAVVLGGSHASGTDSFAAGIMTNSSSYGATAYNAIAMGQNARATSSNAIAIGRQTHASNLYATAIGYVSSASHQYASVLGGRSGLASGRYSTVLGGFSNEASGVESLVGGNNSTASHSNSIVFGDTASSSAANEITLGSTSDTVRISETYTLPTSDGTNGQVMTTDGSGAVTFADAGGGGADLFAENYDGTSTLPSATGTNAVAIGDSSTASGSNSFAFGTLSVASGSSTFAAGYDAVSSGGQSFAFGDNVNATGQFSFCTGGGNATASGQSSIAMSYGAVASGLNSVSIGRHSNATGSSSVALGHSAKAISGTQAVAIGDSYASGADSLAAAIANNSSSYGATGANSIAIGRQAKASGADSFAIGDNNIVANSDAFALGNTNNVTGGATAFAIGNNHTVSGTLAACIGGSTSTATQTYAMTFGPYAKAAVQNAFIFGSKGWFSAGSAQGGMYILYADTTDATATVLTTTNSTAGSTNQIIAASDTCIMFSGTLVAMQNGAQDQGGWEIKGLLKNDGGTTTLVSSNIQTFDDGNGWTVALTADNTNNALAITCTGEAAHNIRWVANIQTSEVTYA